MTVQQQTLGEPMDERGFLRRLSWFDWLWAAVLLAGAGYAGMRYGAYMNGYERGILAGAYMGLVALGWTWKAVRPFTLTVFLVALFAVARYPNLQAADHDFWLKYFVSSQSALMWMSALFPAAMLTYFGALFLRSEWAGKVATALTWTAAGAGLVGMLVRWYQSYLMGPDIGHIPVSDLYEVFILFSIITSLLYLFYERRFQTRALGGFVLMIISSAIGFMLWYQFTRDAAQIQPLIPALQSYWMKMHVPANFIGYGSFALAAMVGVAYLVRSHPSWGGALAARGFPELEQLDDLMYKAIALGFAFFTVATILGALWAAEAWGGYWSWDPKETWALIVWLNYAAWLHLRFTKGWRGKPMAWWAIGGLFVTLFAFLGVNIFLSGLHSYGQL